MLRHGNYLRLFFVPDHPNERQSESPAQPLTLTPCMSAHQEQRSIQRSYDQNKMVLSLHHLHKLSLSRSIYRPAVAPLSCAAVKFSPSQAPSDPGPNKLR